jgi:hypothetical protein
MRQKFARFFHVPELDLVELLAQRLNLAGTRDLIRGSAAAMLYRNCLCPAARLVAT